MAWKTDEGSRVLFHHYNAPAHESVVVMYAVRDCGFKLIDQPPYSPDLAPSDKDRLRGNAAKKVKNQCSWPVGKVYN